MRTTIFNTAVRMGRCAKCGTVTADMGLCPLRHPADNTHSPGAVA